MKRYLILLLVLLLAACDTTEDDDEVDLVPEQTDPVLTDNGSEEAVAFTVTGDKDVTVTDGGWAAVEPLYTPYVGEDVFDLLLYDNITENVVRIMNLPYDIESGTYSLNAASADPTLIAAQFAQGTLDVYEFEVDGTLTIQRNEGFLSGTVNFTAQGSDSDADNIEPVTVDASFSGVTIPVEGQE
jgi:hypothetical protein